MKTLNFNLLFVLFVAFGLASCSDDNSVPSSNPNDGREQGLVLEDPVKTSKDLKNNGFYIVNEDRIGVEGTINYVASDYSLDYRVYMAANPGELLGMTTTQGVIYGDNIYFISKQGNRVVVADKNTLKKKTAIRELGGDGRSFVGVSSQKGYVGHGAGITTLDLTNYQVGKQISGIPKSQVGNMLYVNKHVIAICSYDGSIPYNDAVLIDTEKDEIVKWFQIPNAISVARSMDGDVWVISNQSLVRINPATLEEVERVDISTASASDTWAAWNAGPLTASSTENILYWTAASSWLGGATKIHKYDIETKTLTPNFYQVTTEKAHQVEKDFGLPGEEDAKLSFYGASVRVHPASGDLYLIVKRDGFDTQTSLYNWIFIVDTTGKLKKTIAIKDEPVEGTDEIPQHYWFPSHVLFKDECKPQILLKEANLEVGQAVKESLTDVIFDEDTPVAHMEIVAQLMAEGIVDVAIQDNSLMITPLRAGSTSLVLKVNSNGNLIERSVDINVSLPKE